jgi:hypothetical protein
LTSLHGFRSDREPDWRDRRGDRHGRNQTPGPAVQQRRLVGGGVAEPGAHGASGAYPGRLQGAQAMAEGGGLQQAICRDPDEKARWCDKKVKQTLF